MGQVALSHDLGFAAVFLSACLVCIFAGKSVGGGLVAFTRDALRGATGSFSGGGQAIAAGALAAGEALLALCVAVVGAALAIGLAQSRCLFRRTLMPVGSGRLFPRLRRLLGPDGLVFAGSALAKVVALLLAAAVMFAVVAPTVLGLAGACPRNILNGLFVTSKTLGEGLALAMIVLGLGDYVWQLRRHSKALRMTADEVKREQKEAEGDPVFKQERKRIHRDLAQAFANIAGADVVVVDPHSAAVALRFDPKLADAPVVLRSGRGVLASSLQSSAAAAGVPIVANSKLAAALAQAEEGDEISEALYESVAELFADVAHPSLSSHAESPSNSNASLHVQ